MNAPATGLLTKAHGSSVRRSPLVSSLERRRLEVHAVQFIADGVSVLSGLVLAAAILQGTFPAPTALLLAQLLLPVYLTIAIYQGAYSTRSLTELQFALRRSGMALAVSAALLFFITYYVRSPILLSRAVMTVGLALTYALLVGSRIALQRVMRRLWGPSVINVLVIDDGGPAVGIDGAIHVDAAAMRLTPDLSDPHCLDRIGRYFVNMDRVVVSCPAERRQDWAFILRAAGIRGELTSDSLHELRPLGLSDNGSSVSLIVSAGPLGIRARTVKRVFDCTVAVIAMAAVAPIMLAIALLIKLEDGGPVLFVQRRLGQGNRFFEMYKFRSMRVASSDAEGNRSASRGDDRCTRIGRFIRSTSIDELPQLWNVLRGEMSMIGPRPHALGSQAGDKLFWEVDGLYWHRHALKPGLTGLAQVRGLRGATEQESDLEGRLRADLEYITSWSPLQDVGIAIKTMGVLMHRQAY
jgi:lipopolysaccharide/colanic/teichoic acid biosynthesis glycosyltransferase